MTDALRPSAQLTVQAVTVAEGELLRDQEADLAVDEATRTATARNHTTTHLLHAALRAVLGDHVKQAGSLVGPDRLRFDFQHISAMTPAEIARVEALVNEAVLADTAVDVREMDHAEAVAEGAIALFGEKYAERVRVVRVPGVSMELCGGTHLRATGQAGPFVILSESGVAAGVRRIEGATGHNALAFLRAQREAMAQVAELLRAKPQEAPERVRALQKEIKTLRKDLEKAATQAAAAGPAGDILDAVETVGGVRLLAVKTGAPHMGALRSMLDAVRSRLDSNSIIALACEADGKANLIVAVSRICTRASPPRRSSSPWPPKSAGRAAAGPTWPSPAAPTPRASRRLRGPAGPGAGLGAGGAQRGEGRSRDSPATEGTHSPGDMGNASDIQA